MEAEIFRLEGKRALITGASGGIGAHIAAVLGRAGASLVLAARRREALEETAAVLRRAGCQAEVMTLDVSDIAAVSAGIDSAGAFDILINNAGIVRSNSALEQSEADWDAVVDTNLKGMFFVAQAVARGMRRDKRPGSIVNIASILGLRQAGGVLPYAVSKSGVIQLTKALALELARFDIRVNALAPGYLSTDLNEQFFQSEAGQAMIRRIPMRRLGHYEDLDGPVLLLASDASRYMSGAIVPVDGGHLVSGL